MEFVLFNIILNLNDHSCFLDLKLTILCGFLLGCPDERPRQEPVKMQDNSIEERVYLLAKNLKVLAYQPIELKFRNPQKCYTQAIGLEESLALVALRM